MPSPAAPRRFSGPGLGPGPPRGGHAQPQAIGAPFQPAAHIATTTPPSRSCSQPMNWIRKKRRWAAAIEDIACDARAIKLLGAAYTEDGARAFGLRSWEVLGMDEKAPPEGKGEWAEKFHAEFQGWCGQLKEALPPILQKARRLRNEASGLRYRFRHNIVLDTYIHPAAPSLRPLPPPKEISAAKLDEPYPPRGYWPCESQEIFDLWDSHLRTRDLADDRNQRPQCLVVDDSRLTTIRSKQSRLIYDVTGKNLVGVVLRNFCGNAQVLDWADDIVKEATRWKKSVRVRILV